MKIYMRIRKETYSSGWMHREEVDEIETSFELERIEEVITRRLESLINDDDNKWEIDMKNKTAILKDECSTKKIQHIIKTIEI